MDSSTKTWWKMSNSLGSKLREIDARRRRRRDTCMNYRRRSKAFHVAVVRHVSQTCRREKAARVDRSMHSVSVIVGSPCSCPTRNKSTALRTPRGDSEENWSIAKISLVLHATSDLFSLSLSLSRGSAVDLREMEEQGSDFHRRTSVQYSLGQGRRGGSTR